MLCIAIATAMIRPTFIPDTFHSAMAIPSGKLCKKIPKIKYIAVNCKLVPCSGVQSSGWMWGMSLSKANITSTPVVTPATQMSTEERRRLSGIN